MHDPQVQADRTEPSPRGRARVLWYGCVIFLSSAFLLVIEITAGRLIAPYVGVSLYTWTSVIGVILAGLSLGNWAGGRWADRGAAEEAAGIVLALGSLACLAVLLLLNLLAPLIQTSNMNLVGASFLYVLVLFFVPATLLGVVTPLLTTLALRLDSRTGHIVGRMHALAALGSILGTFVTGYWLVQAFGTRNIVIGTAAGMFLLSLPFLRQATRWGSIVLLVAALLVTLTYYRQGFANPCTRESRYYCMRVIDESDALSGVARTLVLDHMAHSTNHATRPAFLLTAYVQAMDELIHRRFGPQQLDGLNYFFAGGGAYTQPRAVRATTANAKVTVAEIDPAVTALAVAELFFDPTGIDIVHEDARAVLSRQQAQSFDVIVTDVFHDVAVPYHLTTLEYVSLVKTRLRSGGLYLANVVDVFPDPRLVKAIVRTLDREFERVDIWMEAPPAAPTRLTYVVSANDGSRLPDTVSSRRGPQRTWFRVTDAVLSTGAPLSGIPLLQDDYAPVERLVAPLLLTPAGL